MNRCKIVKACCLVFCGFMSLVSCKKGASENPKTPSSNADVCVVGSVTASNGVTVAAYWKNGSLVKVGDSTSISFANSIVVNGSDVYVGGASTTQSSQTVATYWKNGVATKLTDGTLQSSVTDMILVGGNLYVAGNSSYSNGNQVSEHWINTPGSLVLDSSKLNVEVGIGVIGQDVYVAGFNSIPWSGKVKGAYLKDGQIKLLQPNSIVLAMNVNGSDVYLCGGTASDSLWSNSIATYWKNGVATAWGDPNGYTNATSFAVSGTDIYMAGYSSQPIAGGPLPKSVYWKNGTATTLTGNTATNVFSSIAVLGPDVYVTGQINGKPGYWLNGMPVLLNGNNGNAMRIVLVAKSAS